MNKFNSIYNIGNKKNYPQFHNYTNKKPFYDYYYYYNKHNGERIFKNSHNNLTVIKYL